MTWVEPLPSPASEVLWSLQAGANQTDTDRPGDQAASRNARGKARKATTRNSPIRPNTDNTPSATGMKTKTRTNTRTTSRQPIAHSPVRHSNRHNAAYLGDCCAAPGHHTTLRRSRFRVLPPKCLVSRTAASTGRWSGLGGHRYRLPPATPSAR